jgi:hypothetical protein
MKLNYTRGCINDWLGIDDIREVDMTDDQRKEYFKKISEKLPELDPGWFNYFLQWICEEFGEYNYDSKPCECCGDITEWYDLEI